MTAARTVLPNRRPCETVTIGGLDGRPIDICVGYDQSGRVREIFADGHKIGSDADAALDDGLVMASILLQHGVSVSELSRHIGRESIVRDAPAASMLGLAIEAAAKLEATV